MGLMGTKELLATIDAAASLSDAVDVKGSDILRIGMPAAWTAADLTFQQLYEDGVWRDMHFDWGGEIWLTAAVDISIDCSVFVQFNSVDQIKVRSGTSGAPVAQIAPRTIRLVVGAR